MFPRIHTAGVKGLVPPIIARSKSEADTPYRHLWDHLALGMVPGKGHLPALIGASFSRLLPSGSYRSGPLGSELYSAATTDGGAAYDTSEISNHIVNEISIVWRGSLETLGQWGALICMPYRMDGTWANPFFAWAFHRQNQTTEGRFYIARSSSTASNQSSDSGYIAAGEGDTQYAVTRSGGTVKFYKNGELFSTHTGFNTSDIDIPSEGEIVLLNRSSTNNGEGNVGAATSSFVFNRELTTREIQELYRDPFGLVRPVRRIWVPTAAGGGGTTISVSEAGAGADALSNIAVSLSLADAASGLDALPGTLASLGVSDVGAGADSVTLAVQITLSDAGLGTDAVDILTATLKTVTDAAAGSDAVTVSVSPISVVESASGSDALQISAVLSVSDVGSGVGAVVSSIAVAVAEAASGADAVGTISAQVAVVDTANASDVIDQILAAVAVADTATAVEVAIAFVEGVIIVTISARAQKRQISASFSKRDITFALT